MKEKAIRINAHRALPTHPLQVGFNIYTAVGIAVYKALRQIAAGQKNQ
jgi:tRNA(Leu) C34 or U34 (ribose-2'-O)-methylase TrmL